MSEEKTTKAEQIILDYTASTKWEQIEKIDWTTVEVMDVFDTYFKKQEETHERSVLKHIKVGDVIIHSRCMGCVEVHRFIGMEGSWMCGVDEKGDGFVNDIYPKNVLYINGEPVDSLDFFESLRPGR